MPVETRYMHCNSDTVNGWTGWLLLLDLVGCIYQYHTGSAPGNLSCRWYVSVWLVKPSGSRTYLGDSTTVYRTTDGIGYQTCTFNCPETDASPNDAVMVVVHQFVGGAHSSVNFITPQLNIGKLNAATWTIYLYTQRRYDTSRNTTTGALYWAWDPYMMSRIENFSWEEAAPVVARRVQGDGLTWIVS